MLVQPLRHGVHLLLPAEEVGGGACVEGSHDGLHRLGFRLTLASFVGFNFSDVLGVVAAGKQ